MTRRKFIQKLISIVLGVIASVSEAISKSSVPKGHNRLPRRFAPRNDSKETLKEPQFSCTRKFVRAVRLEKYPGSLKSLRDICKQNNWSG
jgi:hypothetical protein